MLELQAQAASGETRPPRRKSADQQAVETFEVIARRFLTQRAKTVKPKSRSETERHLLTVAKIAATHAAVESSNPDGPASRANL